MFELVDYIFNAVLCGVIAWIWIKIILDVSNLGFIYDFFYKIMDKNKVSRYAFKPLFECFYCFGGQLSLWWYLISNGLDNYNMFYHIGFISISILTTQIINKKYG